MNVDTINMNKQAYEKPAHPKIETGKFKDKKVTIIESIESFLKKIWTAIKQFFVSLYDRCIKKQPKVLPAINHLPKNNTTSKKTNDPAKLAEQNQHQKTQNIHRTYTPTVNKLQGQDRIWLSFMAGTGMINGHTRASIRKGNEQYLENHDFIQAIFPGYKKGARPAPLLNKALIQEMTQNRKTELDQFISEMVADTMLPHWGIKQIGSYPNAPLKDCNFKIINKEKAVRWQGYGDHNEARIKRMFRFLGATGHKEYAVKLCKFMQQHQYTGIPNKQWNDVLSISPQPIIQQNPSRPKHRRNPVNKNSAPTHQVLRAQTVQQQQYSVSDNVPRAIFIIGGSASGKNGLANEIMGLKDPQVPKRAYRLIDADQIKKEDPEYQQLAQEIKSHVPANHDIAANTAFDNHVKHKGTNLHWKAVRAKNAQINTALTQKQHFIHTTTATDEIYFTGLVNKFKQAGFYVKIYFVDVDLDTCLQRAKTRQDFSGRFIPTEVIKKSNTDSRQLFNQTYRQIAHTARRYENNSQLKMIEKIRNDYSGLSLQPKRN
ncbi:zeta toxin family protein [Endozoicomonas ascidiicola]|uniref:zeta toxin family protein n=1 Tax=Endozoicomonas ascidiicola TaxID=1698521 RepID=UPI00082AF113|nr:zeta toxin family protein [Endozoicomonas ascidiicola]